MTKRGAFVWVISGLCFSVALSADALVMRDGSRLQGDLISVTNGTVEFNGPRGRVRVDRSEVARIELDDYRSNRPDPAPGSSRPSGLRERDVTVNANTAWQDTSVTVRPGQTVYFRATGRVRWGPGRQDGPEGENRSPRNDARPMPSRPGAALIGRIGDSADYFFIGSDDGPIRMRQGGRLFLGINDDFLGDNSGSFRVTVYY